MPEPRSLPLRDVAKPGRYGTGGGAPGVRLSIVHPLTLVSVIARKGEADRVTDGLHTLAGALVMWAGADQYLVEGIAPAAIKQRLGDAASVIDQSHGRVTIAIAGAKARAVLAKGTPVDLAPDRFAISKCALTQMAHIGVHLSRTGRDEFRLSVYRGFSESFWEWLTISAAEFGYEVA